MLKFFGTGNAFSEKNTSAYFIKNNELYIFDCGETVFTQIKKSKVLDNVKAVNLFLTHLHSDHSGSVGSLLFYLASKDFPVENARVFFPEQDKIYNLLTLFDVQDLCVRLSQKDVEKMNVLPVKQKHNRINSFGYLFSNDNKTEYFSGDTQEISQEILDLFKAGKIDRLYVDTSFDKNGEYHLYYKKLDECIPKNLRKKVTCMHLKDGFNKNLLSDYDIAKAEEYNYDRNMCSN